MLFGAKSFFGALILGVLLLSPLSATAKHIIGGEVTYECLGETSAGSGINRYLITMRIYRDCDPTTQGADFDSPAHFAIYRGSWNSNSLFSTFDLFDYDEPSVPVDTPACILTVPYVCVEAAVYTTVQDLPVSATQSYFIVYQRCCRNNSIVNIIEPEDVGATYYAEITPRAQQVCNNSPVFNDFPPIIICKDSPLRFDHSATDTDGDQLVYSFCAPHVGGGPVLNNPDFMSCIGAMPTPPCAPPFDAVPFVLPTYSPTNPMGGNPQITINPVTGLITGVPKILGRFVVGVCVDEYRNGVLLSTTKRDFQFNVTDCDPLVLAALLQNSELDTLIVTPQGYYLSSCGDDSLLIKNDSKDRSFIGDDFEWRFDLNGTPYFNNSDWDPVIKFPGPGRYFGQLYLKPGEDCGDTTNITVDIFPAVNANFSYAYDTCVAEAVAFTDLSTGDGGLATWRWQFGVPNGTSTERNPEFLYGIPGNHPVRLTVVDSNGCADVVTKIVKYFPAPPILIVKPNSYTGCAPGEILFNNLSTPIDETYQVEWDFGDGGTNTTDLSPTHLYTEPGVYSVSLRVTSPIGCSIADTFPNLIRVVPSPVADFSFDPTVVTNLNPTVNFTDQSKDANRWYWQFDEYGYSNQQNPTFTFPDTGLMRVLLVVTHPEGCKDSLSKYLDVIPEIRWFMPNAFTPNGDGTNDGFFGKGFLEGASGFTMTIWNRWGELVYETNNPSDAWNGRAQGTGGPSPAGVYVYRVTFTGPRGEPFDYRGFATLVR